MPKKLALPALALCGGVLGAILRRWQLATAFEADTGLPIAGAPATTALLVLSLVMAGLLLIMVWPDKKRTPGEGYDGAFGGGGSLPATLLICSGFLLLAGGILKIMTLPVLLREAAVYSVRPLMSSLPHVLQAFFALPCGLSVLWLAKQNYRREGKGTRNMLLLVPPFFCCLWLIAAYQVRAADPVLADYVFELFAIMATLLASYFMAGFSFEKAKVRRTAYFSLLGIYLSCVALADLPSLPQALFFAFSVLYLTASVFALYQNLRPSQDEPGDISPEGGVH